MKKRPNAVNDDSDQSPASKAVQNAALDYAKKLRKQNPVQYERPQVTLIETDAGKCHSTEVIKNAAREQLKKARQTNNTVNEGSRLKMGQGQRPESAHGADLATAESSASSSSLSPRDSPLTKVFLGQYLSLLMQETITYRKIRYSELAQEMSIPEMVLQDAVQGKLGLTRGQWVKLGQLLRLPTTFELRPSERNGTPCWEVCYAPIRAGQPTHWW